MAKNWTAYEAAQTIIDGKDFDAIVDIMKRFPVFGMTAIKLNDAALSLLKVLPENMTARKFNAYLRDSMGLTDEDTTEDDYNEDDYNEDDEKPVKEDKKKGKRGRPAKKAEDPEEDEDDDDEDEAPKKKPGKRGRPAKKSKKPVDEDDDDDFDFDYD